MVVFGIITQLDDVGTPDGNQFVIEFQSVELPCQIFVVLVTVIGVFAEHPFVKSELAVNVNVPSSNCASVGFMYTLAIGVPVLYAVRHVESIYASTGVVLDQLKLLVNGFVPYNLYYQLRLHHTMIHYNILF